VISRLTGAIVRAFLVMVLVAMPSVILPGLNADSKQMVALVALFAGALTFVEYNATYPGLIEFRDAPPFNRSRFMMLFAVVFSLSLAESARIVPSTFALFVQAVGVLIGQMLDFAYSPVRLAQLMLADGATGEQRDALRSAAGLSYLMSLGALGVFAVVMRAGRWPSHLTSFNVWVNLPTFDPTAGHDVIDRLVRDARVNIVLGILLPFLAPVVIRLGTGGFDAGWLSAPQPLIWTMAAWTFLPASLFMRGIAMARVADLVRQKRRAHRIAGHEALLAA